MTTDEKLELRVIAHIHNDYTGKFGIPRQSGLVPDAPSSIIFTPTYRNPDALRGIEEFSHLWLVWEFSENLRANWSATVRPPRLGGNITKGVFATRSPFRPNPLGLSLVKLERVQWESTQGPILWIKGADLLNGTPLFDIKPYLPHIESVPEAKGGFATAFKDYALQVQCPPELLAKIPQDKQPILLQILAQDPRPGYEHDEDRIYGLSFAEFNIRFQVQKDTVIVREIAPK
jgi:tRNA-Thr(GGU) m(6)t(6)A37 methyltransferase TsaA